MNLPDPIPSKKSSAPSPESLILGIDCGTSVTKIAAFSPDGREVAVAQSEMSSESPLPGRMEFSTETLWLTFLQAMESLHAQIPDLKSRVAAIGLTGAGNGLLLVDGDGHPVRPGIIATDARTVEQTSRPADFSEEARRLHGQCSWTGQTVELLAWVARNEPEVLAACKKIFLRKDFLKWKLTDVFATDISEMSKTGLLGISSGTYEKELFDLYGIPDCTGRLPQIGASTDVVAGLSAAAAAQTGLSAGTPVINGLADVDACAIGGGAVADGQLSIVAGSWSINQLFTSNAGNRSDIFGTSRHAVPGLWEELEAAPSSAANLTWFVKESCRDLEEQARSSGKPVFAIVDDLVASLPPCTSEVFFHPYLYGSRFYPKARAGFYGLAGWHDRRHMLLALFEGVAFSHALHVEHLLRDGRRAVDVCLSGGASRSKIWSQMFADVLGLELRIPSAKEIGALGAAMTAAVGAGMAPDLKSAVATMQHPAMVCSPDMGRHADYQRRLSSFRSITQLMRAVWDEIELSTKPASNQQP